MPSWTSRYALMDFKVSPHGLQSMPLWTSRYAIMDYKVCHHGLQGMPSWTTRYAIMDYKVCHQRFQGMLLWICIVWVLHIAKVAYFFSSSLPNMKFSILKLLPFFFYQKSFIFHFLENCF